MDMMKYENLEVANIYDNVCFRVTYDIRFYFGIGLTMSNGEDLVFVRLIKETEDSDWKINSNGHG